MKPWRLKRTEPKPLPLWRWLTPEAWDYVAIAIGTGLLLYFMLKGAGLV